MIDALRTGFTGDPDGLREYALDVMSELGQSAMCGWYEFGMVRGEPRPVRWKLRGVHQDVLRRQFEEDIPWPHADPRIPSPSWNRRFRMRGSVIDVEKTFWPSRLYQRCFKQFGVEDQLRMVVFHEGEFIGWAGVFRGPKDPRYVRADARRLQPIADALADALITAKRTERRGGAEQGADVVLTPSGKIDYASAEALAWIDKPEVRLELRRWLDEVENEAADQAARARPRVIDGCALSWSRLYGQSGRTRYLLHVEPYPIVRIHPSFELSRTQRKIAEFAAAGAAAHEIGQMLGIAPSTVRTHLREVYRILHVGSRAELVRVLDSPAPEAVRDEAAASREEIR